MKMKKFFALLLSLSMVLSLAACGSKGNSNDSQTDGETASDLHLGYDINTGENHYGPYYDEWSDKTDEELFEEALKEDTTINVYATSSKMMKVEEGFEAAYPGLDLVVSDLKTDEVLSKAKIEHDTGNITADVRQRVPRVVQPGHPGALLSQGHLLSHRRRLPEIRLSSVRLSVHVVL